jgi:hypothetical protein
MRHQRTARGFGAAGSDDDPFSEMTLPPTFELLDMTARTTVLKGSP